MKKLLFVADMIVTSIVEYLCAKYILFGTYFGNFKILGLYSREERTENLFLLLFSPVIMLIIQFIFCLIGKKLCKDWRSKDGIIYLISSAVVSLITFAGYVILNP